MTQKTNLTSISKIDQFYNVLFDPGQTTCFSASAFGTSVYDAHNIQNLYHNYNTLMFFSINALHTKRCDDNVTCYRNFLIENDKIKDIKDQISLVKKIGMPFSTATYSGSKSVHFIISLETPLRDRKMYDFVARWIHNIINKDLLVGESGGPGDMRFDDKTKNPSRFSRVPGGTNIKYDDDGNLIRNKEQTVLAVKGRIPDAVMQDWLLSHEDCKPQVNMYQHITPSDTANPLLLKKWSTYLLENGIHEGKRNNSFYELGFDFIQAGFSLEEAIQYVHEQAKHLGNFPFAEVESAMKSAYKRFWRDKNDSK